MSTTNYFIDCKTFDQAKKQFRKMAFMLHPDRGGNADEFKALLHQFENFDAETLKYKTERENWHPSEFVKIINNLVAVPGINVEVIGSWVWVDGDTKPVSASIKASIEDSPNFVCKWNRKREVWQIHEDGYQRFTKTEYSREDIANYYGSKKYANEAEQVKTINY